MLRDFLDFRRSNNAKQRRQTCTLCGPLSFLRIALTESNGSHILTKVKELSLGGDVNNTFEA